MNNIFKVNGKVKILPLLICTLIPLIGGIIIVYLNKNSLQIYSQLDQPFRIIPPIVFPIVWTILYLLMGLASYRIYMVRESGKDIGDALFFFFVQLLLNYLWFFIFFSFRLYGVSFIELIVLFIFSFITFIKFIKIDRFAGYLFIPYILWLMFAGVLDFFVWMKNEM